MNLEYRRVCYGTNRYRRVKRLYCEAFPENEQLPLWLLSVVALHPDIDFYAIYDSGDFCGLLYLVNDRDRTLIFYFAVGSDLRGKGYGAEILKWVRSRKRSVLLIMESMREECNNADQRLRRRDFYLRNGFQDTGYYMKSRGIFDILSTEPAINPADTAKLIRRLTRWMGLSISVGKF